MTSMSVAFGMGDERAIAVEGPEREISGVEAVRQHGSAEEHAVDGAVWPRAVAALRPAKPGNAAPHRLARPENLHERKERPAGHDRLALRMFDIGPGETSGVMLAPATIGLLLVDEPGSRAREGGIVEIDARGAQRRGSEPGRIGEVEAPEPRK